MSEIRVDNIKNEAGDGAPNIPFDNTESVLDAENVQDAIDEGIGGIKSIQEVSADATVTAPPAFGTSLVIVDAATATITIPEGVPVGGRVHVKKIHATQGTVTIARSGTDTITRANLDEVELNADGDHWLLQKVSATRWELMDGVESGSNGDGEYTRRASGEQKCNVRDHGPSMAGVNVSQEVEWDYPKPFTQLENILANFNTVDAGGTNIGTVDCHPVAPMKKSGITKAFIFRRRFGPNGAGGSGTNITAVGRWYT